MLKMNFDPATILGVSVITALIIGVVLLVFERAQNGKMPYLRLWAYASLLQALGLTVVAALREAVPFSLGILAGNALLMGALTLYLWVVADYAGKPVKRWQAIGVNLLHLAALSCFLYIWPNVSARICVFSSFAALMMLAGAVKLLRRAAKEKPAERLTALLFASGGVAMMVRAALQYPFATIEFNPISAPGSYAGIFHVILLLVNLAFTLGFSLICVERFRTEGESATRQVADQKEMYYKQFEMLPLSACVWRISGDDFVLERANFAAQVMTEGRIWSLTGAMASSYHAQEPQVLLALRECRDRSGYFSREIPHRPNPEAGYVVHSMTFNRISPELIAVYTEVKN